MFDLFNIHTFRAILFDKLSMSRCSSVVVPKNCAFLMFNFATINVYFNSLILYFFPFGVKIKKLVFLLFNESLLVLNQVENLCS